MNHLVLTLVLLGQPITSAGEPPVIQPSKADIVEVTVYTDRARITRTASVNLPPGNSVIMFKDLTAGLDEASIRARILKAKDARVNGLAAEWQGSIEPPREKEAKLTGEIEALNAKILGQRDQLDALAQRRRMLDRYRQLSQDAIGKNAGGNSVSSSRWNASVAFLTREQSDIASKQRTINKKIVDLNETLRAKHAELNKLRAPSARRTRRVEVAVEAARAGRVEVALDYVVYNAWWQPAYDVRESSDKLEFTYYGTVTQGTGEDWDKVALTLSTARPSESAQVPKLKPLQLTGYKREKRPVTIVSYGKTQKKLEKERITLTPDSTTLGGEGRAVVDDKGTAVTFKIKDKETIPADRRPHKVQVMSTTLAAKLNYETIPKIAPWVYLKATATNSTDFPILAGAVDVFRSSGYIGTGHLAYVATSEEFHVSLGVDEDLKVRRVIDKKVDQKPKFLGTKRSLTHAYEIEVSNYKTAPKTITVVENVPVSQRKEVEVSLGEKSTKGAEKNDDGIVKWKIVLKPEETKMVYFTYSVVYPKDFQISGL